MNINPLISIGYRDISQVKCDTLENWRGFTTTVGSNPTPTASLRFVRPGDIGNRLYLRHR